MSMDLQLQQKMDGFDSSWTDEKHLSFLNSIEASFVRRMFENDDRCFFAHRPKPRLDRYLPDGADSTLDFKHNNSRGKTLDLTPERAKLKMLANSSKNKKRRKGSCVRDNPSILDQVVPFLGNEAEEGLERARK